MDHGLEKDTYLHVVAQMVRNRPHEGGTRALEVGPVLAILELPDIHWHPNLFTEVSRLRLSTHCEEHLSLSSLSLPLPHNYSSLLPPSWYSTALIWIEISYVVSGIRWSHSSSLGGGSPHCSDDLGDHCCPPPLFFPSALSNLGISPVFHHFSDWCFGHLGPSLLSLQPFCPLCSPQCPAGLPSSVCQSVYGSRTAHSFFTTSEGVSKFDRRVSSPNLAQMSLHTIPSTCWDFLNKLDLLSSYTLIVSWASLQACTLGIGRSGRSWLYHSCTWDLCLCCQDQYFCALYQSSLFQLEFSDINHFLDVGMRYIPCMYQERWQVSSSPCGQNIWGVLVVVVATLEQGTKHPIAHIEPCYEFVTHSEVCPAFAHI